MDHLENRKSDNTTEAPSCSGTVPESSVCVSHSSETKRLVIAASHRGRGSFATYRVLASAEEAEAFLEELDKDSAPPVAGVWSDDGAILERLDTDWSFGMGVVRVTPNDRWLLFFDPGCDAARKNEIGVVGRGDDLDTVVKQRYMKTVSKEDNWAVGEDEEGNREVNWEVPDGRLDWTGKTTYNCIAERYWGEGWGWADGSDSAAPFLTDCTHPKEGIARFDLDSLGLWENRP